MHTYEIALYSLIAVTCFTSYQVWQTPGLNDKYLFWVGKIRDSKEYYRLFTSGFLHADWSHLLFNMLSLYFFGGFTINALGLFGAALLYAGSLLGGSLLSLFLNRADWNYRAYGASGAVSGVVFSTILMAPGIMIFFIPGFLYGILYLVATMWGIRTRWGNIGHGAHLGGALAGMLIALIWDPMIVVRHPIMTTIYLGLPILFLLVQTYRPVWFFQPEVFWNDLVALFNRLRTPSDPSKSNIRIVHQSGHRAPVSQEAIQAEIDQLLDIGHQNLTEIQRRRLAELSRNLDE
ncbi:rhomboid family intramembrane serine protease [Pontibacter sp. G13]|uniref:rhomboid family intramembrane serine protease n=1 Tax=Pontibacter sp. G13 TaxID=3074898 RepID=UPI00288A25EB|nr:rhomboid family intramembrane serine protease [Pontibacter sp. G13]WNJ16881.1 rhomboid family intramembrane serine protease [Pontibacter sp. G13]